MENQTTSRRGKKGADKRPIKPIRKKDMLFKVVGKLRGVYLALVRENLPLQWLKLLDLDRTELIDTVSVDGTLRERLGDLVLKIPFRSGHGDLILGLEQQTQGTFPPERGLCYQVRLLRAARKASSGGKVAAVCTVVLFSCEMPSSQDADIFAGLSEEEKGLARTSLGTIIPVELGKIPDERLREKGMAGLLELFLKHERGKSILPLLESLWPRLRSLREKEDGREFVESVINYSLLAAPQSERDVILKGIGEQLGPQEEEIAMTVASALIHEGKQLGRLEGKLEGKQLGRLEGKLETARNLLVAGVDLQVVSKATGLSRQKLAALRKKK